MSNLLGLNRRHPKCKICTSFNDEILNQITLDLSTQQRTWNEIIEYYNQFLPASTNPLNVVNLNSHKKHINFGLLALEQASARVNVRTPEEQVWFQKFYEQEFADPISYPTVLQEAVRQRIGNLSILQGMFDRVVKNWQMAVLSNKTDDMQVLELKIKELQGNIDETLGDLSKIVSQQIRTDKGLGETQIVVNVVQIVDDKLKAALTELMGILMLEEFAKEPEMARRIHRRITSVLDKYVSPVLEEFAVKQLSESAGGS